MKIRISKKTKRILVIYLAIVVILYIVVFQIPKVTDKFETTQVLENGTLEVSCEAEGYIIKDEAVCTAGATGTIEYKLNDGTVVKKGTDIADIDAIEEEKGKEKEPAHKYGDYLDRLKKFDLLVESYDSPISGVVSYSIDGYEKYFRIDNLGKIRKEKAEDTSPKQLDLDRTDVVKGEPIFKISSDDNWYIVCWLEKSDAEKFEPDQKVKIELDDATLDARVFSVDKEGDFFRVSFFLNVYYENFCSARVVDMSIVQSNTTGLIVNNECLIKKNGVLGVYVKTKDGDTYFKPVKVKITDGEQSVLYESIFINDKYEQVETVSAYQEVLKNPQDALEQDLKNDAEED
ncbi:MAG: HlyD family efflux transporter periplasmic adaptor subunit [Bacillota bacterium]|nr:HlyD family efflux transporter periplasmic adaptor subunit [Bacillota bacterium]